MSTPRIAVIGILAVFVAGAAYFFASQKAATPGATASAVSIRMPIPIVESGQAPFYVALDRGYYRDQNLKVTVNLGSPELNPVRMVTAGADTFGVLGGPDTLLVARSKGAKLKAIAVLHRNANFSCIITLKSSGITTLGQLENKKVGFYYGHISTDVLRSLFRKENVHVEEVDTGFNYNPLIAGQVDASWGFTVTAGLELPFKGIPINIISPANFGIVTQGYTIFASDKEIAEHPEVVQRFLEATLKAVGEVVADPKAGVDAIHARSPQTPLPLLTRRQAGYSAVTSNSSQYPAGYMDREMFQSTYDRLVELGVVKSRFDVKDAYTTQFLEKIYNRRFE